MLNTWLIVMIVVMTVMALLVVYMCVSWYTWHRAQWVDPSIPRVAIDPHEYKGKWYEIARRPFVWERGCTASTAEYTLQGDVIKVTNECEKNGFHHSSQGWAYPTRTTGVLAVSFFPGIYGNYTVTYREKDIAIVTNSDKSLLWILARHPELSRSKKSRLLDWLKVHGFNIKDLQFESNQTAMSMATTGHGS